MASLLSHVQTPYNHMFPANFGCPHQSAFEILLVWLLCYIQLETLNLVKESDQIHELLLFLNLDLQDQVQTSYDFCSWKIQDGCTKRSINITRSVKLHVLKQVEQKLATILSKYIYIAILFVICTKCDRMLQIAEWIQQQIPEDRTKLPQNDKKTVPMLAV